MKISLFILGVFAAIVCTEKSAEAEQNYPWCINKPDTPPQCRYTTLEQCLADRLGKGGSLFTQSIPLVTGTTDNQTPEALRLAANSSGSFAMLAAIHRASSLLSNLAPYRNWSKRLLIRVECPCAAIVETQNGHKQIKRLENCEYCGDRR